MSEEEIREQIDLEPDLIAEALSTLLEEGRISREEGGGQPLFTSEVCLIPMDDPAGWETAFFDHFNAVVTAACVKLRNARLRSLPSDQVGGSTYSFQIWEGHPYAEQVLGRLRETRRDLSALREEVDAYNQAHQLAEQALQRVTFYFGQSVIEHHHEDDSPTALHGD